MFEYFHSNFALLKKDRNFIALKIRPYLYQIVEMILTGRTIDMEAMENLDVKI